jgi:hypothetical protein
VAAGRAVHQDPQLDYCSGSLDTANRLDASSECSSAALGETCSGLACLPGYLANSPVCQVGGTTHGQQRRLERHGRLHTPPIANYCPSSVDYEPVVSNVAVHCLSKATGQSCALTCQAGYTQKLPVPTWQRRSGQQPWQRRVLVRAHL